MPGGADIGGLIVGSGGPEFQVPPDFGGGDGGGGIGPPIVASPLRPATNVSVTVVDRTNGIFEVAWKENNTTFVDGNWSIRYTSADVAGNQQGDAQWRGSVYSLSREIGSAVMSDTGNSEFRITIVNKLLRDGWIALAISTPVKEFALPSVPVFVSFSTGNGANPPNVTGPGMTVSYTGALDKTGGSYFVTGLLANYAPPTDISNFAGMHLTVTGYRGSATPDALGPMHRYDGKSGGTQTALFTIPADTGQATGTATMTNASTAVVRLSGTNFAAGMVGNIFGAGNVATTVFSTTITVFTDISHVTLSLPWPFTTGTYNFIVFNDMTFYFVSVGKQGQRNRTLTSHVSVAV